MAVFRCPACNLPLTATEIERTTCPVCGAVLDPDAPVPAPVAVAPARGRRGLWLTGGLVSLLALLFGGGWLASRPTTSTAPLEQPQAEPQLLAKVEPPRMPLRPRTDPRARVKDTAPPAPTASKPVSEAEPVDTAAVAPPDADPRIAGLPNVDPFARNPQVIPEQLFGNRKRFGMRGGPGRGWENFDGPVNPEQQPAGNARRIIVLGAAPRLPFGLGQLQGQIIQGMPLAQGAMPGFEKLDFTGVPLSDDFLRQFSVMADMMRDPNLQNLGALNPLGQVSELNLTRTRVTDAGVEHLRHLPALRVLSLKGTQVTGAGLENLRALEILELNDAPVGDAALKNLAGLRALRSLDVRGTRVTPEGIRELQKAQPKLNILQ